MIKNLKQIILSFIFFQCFFSQLALLFGTLIPQFLSLKQAHLIYLTASLKSLIKKKVLFFFFSLGWLVSLHYSVAISIIQPLHYGTTKAVWNTNLSRPQPNSQHSSWKDPKIFTLNCQESLTSCFDPEPQEPLPGNQMKLSTQNSPGAIWRIRTYFIAYSNSNLREGKGREEVRGKEEGKESKFFFKSLAASKLKHLQNKHINIF